MTKELLFSVALCFISSNGFTRPQDKIEKLHIELVNAKQDTSRAMALVNLCAFYRLVNSDSSIFYGQEALKLSREIKYPGGEVLALGFMSITMRNMGNLPKGLEMSFEALKIGKEEGIEDLTTPALHGISEIYTTLKNYTKAMEYLLKQKTISEHNGNTEGLAFTLRDIGIVFEEKNQFDSAVSYLRQAENVFQKMNREEPLVYETLGDIQFKAGNYPAALEFYKKALKIANGHNEHRASSTSYIKVALLYKISNKLDSAALRRKKNIVEN